MYLIFHQLKSIGTVFDSLPRIEKNFNVYHDNNSGAWTLFNNKLISRVV